MANSALTLAIVMIDTISSDVSIAGNVPVVLRYAKLIGGNAADKWVLKDFWGNEVGMLKLSVNNGTDDIDHEIHCTGLKILTADCTNNGGKLYLYM